MVTLNFQKYQIQQQVYIYIYICFYLCRLHRETIHRETRCAFCRLMQSREMERVTAMNRYFY